MSCERFRKALTDYACGAAISADAEAHLNGCAACRRDVETQRRALADVDAEVAQALAVPVSADFVARVQERVRRQPTSVWPAPRTWALGLAAAAAVMIAVFIAWQPARRPQTTDARILPAEAGSHAAGETPSPTGSHAEKRPILPHPVASGVSRPSTLRGTALSLSKGRKDAVVAEDPANPRREHGARATAQPEVLVPPNQLLAIARLQQLLRGGAIDNSRLPPQKTEAEVLSDLTIEPLTVPAITFPDIETSSRAAADGERDRQS